MKTPEELCRELWLAIDKRSKMLSYGPRVKDVSNLLGISKNMVTQIEAVLKVANEMEIQR